MNEIELQNKFVDYLIKNKGYSEDSLRRELILPKGARADLVSLNPSDNTITAIFEFKNKTSESILKSAALQALRYKILLGGKNVPAFVITPSINENLEFDIYDVTDSGELEALDFNNFPTYASLLSSVKALNKAQNKTDTKDTIDKFKMMCFVFSGIIFIILILDIMKIFCLTSQQLTLLGVSIAIALIPYATKLKILGVEFERFENNNGK